MDADDEFLASLRQGLQQPGVEIASLRPVAPQLEDVFMALVEENP
jgi:hypothetical protein